MIWCELLASLLELDIVDSNDLYAKYLFHVAVFGALWNNEDHGTWIW